MEEERRQLAIEAEERAAAEAEAAAIAKEKAVEDKAAAKEARKARRKEGKKRWKMGVMATLLDENDSDYDDIDEAIVDGVPLPDRGWDSDDSEEGLFGPNDSRADLYRLPGEEAHSTSSYYTTDSDEIDEELRRQKKEAARAKRELAQQMKDVLCMPRQHEFLSRFIECVAVPR